MVFGRSFGLFVLSFFGFYRGKGRGQPPFRRSRISTLIGLTQLTGFILLRVYVCEKDTFGITNLNIFSFIFIHIDSYGLFCIVTVSLSLILLRGDRISRILNETCAILAGMSATSNDKHFTVGYCFLVLHLTASSSYILICSSIQREQCSNCTFTGTVFCIHCLMLVFLFCILILSVRDVFSAVNGRLSSSGGAFAPGEVRALEVGYGSACDLAEELNFFFAEINLIITFVEFVMTVNIFSLLFMDKGIVLINICWFFMYSINCILTVISCSGFYREAQKTARYLHELFIENDDPQVREEIEIFSLQLLHRRVQFDACGFFKLDFTLLNSMIGAVTTYIVILIQFQIAGKNTCATTNSTTIHTNEIL